MRSFGASRHKVLKKTIKHHGVRQDASQFGPTRDDAKHGGSCVTHGPQSVAARAMAALRFPPQPLYARAPPVGLVPRGSADMSRFGQSSTGLAMCGSGGSWSGHAKQ